MAPAIALFSSVASTFKSGTVPPDVSIAAFNASSITNTSMTAVVPLLTTGNPVLSSCLRTL